METAFNIDFKKLMTAWLPTFIRQELLLNYCSAALSPLSSLYIYFLEKRKENIIKVKTTTQKFSMQKRLNDLFDGMERRIKIIRAVQYSGVFLYTEAEDDAFFNKTKWLKNAPIYLRTEAELKSDYDFIVKIPNTGINEYRLRAEIEYYMLQSKNYRIEIIP